MSDIADHDLIDTLRTISRQVARIGFGIYLDETPMRQHLMRSGLIENRQPRGRRANYTLTDKAKRLLEAYNADAR
jgi:hypothetical protein